jgi:hypothetical protein
MSSRVEQAALSHVEVTHQLGQLRDGHAVVGYAFEVEVDAQDRKHETQVDRDGRLACEQRLDATLDLDVAVVHLIIEADHLVGELVVAAGKRVQRRAQRPQHEIALGLQRVLELLELVLEGDSHPNRPVT